MQIRPVSARQAEQMEKEHAAKLRQECDAVKAGSIAGYASMNYTTGMDVPCRAGLRDRVNGQLQDAIRNTQKAQRLAELQDLLDKNPEIARIFDLVEEVRG